MKYERHTKPTDTLSFKETGERGWHESAHKQNAQQYQAGPSQRGDRRNRTRQRTANVQHNGYFMYRNPTQSRREVLPIEDRECVLNYR
jgi:hypothetical protein